MEKYGKFLSKPKPKTSETPNYLSLTLDGPQYIKNTLSKDIPKGLEYQYLHGYVDKLSTQYGTDQEYLKTLPEAIEKIKNTYTINPKLTLVPEETTSTADVFYSFTKKLPGSSAIPFSSNKLMLISLALQVPDHIIDNHNPYAELNIGYIEPEFNQWLAEQEIDDEDYNATLDSYENGETYARICFDQ